jgi:hypothetical protein
MQYADDICISAALQWTRKIAMSVARISAGLEQNHSLRRSQTGAATGALSM